MRATVKALLMRRSPLLLARLLRLKSDWNRDLFAFLNVVRRGDTVFDVGANVGIYTEVFARVVGHSGAVYAFEPVAPTFELLSQRFVPRRNWPQLHLEPLALGMTTGSVRMHMPGADSGQASLRVHEDGFWATANGVRSFPCVATTLDDFITRQNIQRIDFLKVDVEGAELLVLKGGNTVLRRDRPVLFIEVWDHWMRAFDYHPSAVADLLESAGYDMFVVVADEIRRLANVRDDWQAPLGNGSHNLLAMSSLEHTRRFATLHRYL